MRKAPRLASVMTPFPYSIDAGASAGEARAMMEAHEVHHLPVMAGGDIVGMLTARDLDGVAADAAVDGRFTREPYVVDLATTLQAVLLEMAQRHVGSAVITREERLAGVFTWVDACRAFAEHLAEEFPPGGDDEAA